MDVGERFKTLTIYTLMCTEGYLLRQKIVIGVMKSHKSYLWWLGPPRAPDQLQTWLYQNVTVHR